MTLFTAKKILPEVRFLRYFGRISLRSETPLGRGVFTKGRDSYFFGVRRVSGLSTQQADGVPAAGVLGGEDVGAGGEFSELQSDLSSAKQPEGN